MRDYWRRQLFVIVQGMFNNNTSLDQCIWSTIGCVFLWPAVCSMQSIRVRYVQCPIVKAPTHIIHNVYNKYHGDGVNTAAYSACGAQHWCLDGVTMRLFFNPLFSFQDDKRTGNVLNITFIFDRLYRSLVAETSDKCKRHLNNTTDNISITYAAFENAITLLFMLTHWDRVTHICVDTLTIIGSYNRYSPGRRQAIVWTNAGRLLIRPPGNIL